MKGIVNTEEEKLVEKYKSSMKDMTFNEKEIYIYRTAIKISQEYDIVKSILESTKVDVEIEGKIQQEINALVKASGEGHSLFKAIMVHSVCDRESKYRKVYKNALSSYRSILLKCRNLASELNLSDSLELCHLFTYLLWNGYFSVTKIHCYDIQNRLLLPSMYSFDVIKGRGVCLAYSELLNNFLTTCGVNSSILGCKVPAKKGAITYEYRPSIERKANTNLPNTIFLKGLTPLLGGIINNFGNHVVTLIEQDGNMYVYDPTNLCALEILDKDKATLVNGTGEFQIMPLTSIIMHPNSDQGFLLDRLILGEYSSQLSKEHFIESFDNVVQLSNENKNLLDDYYEEIFLYISSIDRQIDKYGNFFNALKHIKKNSFHNA